MRIDGMLDKGFMSLIINNHENKDYFTTEEINSSDELHKFTIVDESLKIIKSSVSDKTFNSKLEALNALRNAIIKDTVKYKD